MEIRLPKKITSFNLYNKVVGELADYYCQEDSAESPSISFQETNLIVPNCVPNILCILLVIRNYHQKKVKVRFEYNPILLHFLYNIRFFLYADKLELMDYDKEYIGGFNDYIEHESRDIHKVHMYYPIEEYYLLDEQTKISKRAAIYENLAYYVIPKDYEEVLRDREKLNEENLDKCIKILAEIICNAKVYSKSICVAYLHTNKYNTSLAVSDIGIGFKESLKQKKQGERLNKESYDIFDEVVGKYTSPELKDFTSIMEALFYSEQQNRINLWELKNIIVNSEGVLRIHTGSTQVVFTSNQCRGCTADALRCVECLLSRRKNDNKYSPIKIFKGKLAGVHIEIEL